MTPLRVVALIVGPVGAYGLVSGLSNFPGLFSRQRVANPVFAKRPPALDALEGLRSSFPANLAIVFGFLLLAVLVGILFAGLLRRLHRQAPLQTLLAGIFVSGSVFTAMPLAITIVKVSEFAFQAPASPMEERQWLEGGATFLNQLHLIFVHSWYLLVGLGFGFLGLAALHGGRECRRAGLAGLCAGIAVVGGEILRASFSAFGEGLPRTVASLEPMLINGGAGVGLMATAWLAWYTCGPGDAPGAD